ncbi:MAG: PIN domain-containing protein, partial [Nanoarchaeota archaeon]
THNIIFLDYPSDDCFKRILTRAIEKKKPFIEKNDHSDYGFKDVVIWESILNFNNYKDFEKIIFFTNDKEAFNEDCVNEFKETNKDNFFYILNTLEEVTKEVANDNGIDLELDKYVKWAKSDYFKDLFMEFLSDYKNINTNEVNYPISKIELINPCKNLRKEELDEGIVLYHIDSVIKVLYEREKDVKSSIEFTVTTLINDINEIQEIVPECEMF